VARQGRGRGDSELKLAMEEAEGKHLITQSPLSMRYQTVATSRASSNEMVSYFKALSDAVFNAVHQWKYFIISY